MTTNWYYLLVHFKNNWILSEMLVRIQFTICPLNDYLETTRNRPPTDSSLYYQISSKHGLRVQYILSLRMGKKLAARRLVNEFKWSLEWLSRKTFVQYIQLISAFLFLYIRRHYHSILENVKWKGHNGREEVRESIM